MKLVDKMLQANEEALIWSAVQRENRHRSIAANTIQQGRIPFGRGDEPFTDGDAQAAHDVFLILQRLERKAEVHVDQQHQLLTPVAAPDSDAVLSRVAEVIEHPSEAPWQPGDSLAAPTDGFA
jgi:hypothetical protein